MAFVTDAAGPDAPRICYVCMPGSPFTGSTLLGLLLDRHPECASIGAATGLIKKTDLVTYACSCGALFRECEFWRQIEARTAALGHPVNVLLQTNFWNTHFRLSHNRAINALLVRSLGSDRVNAVRDALVDRQGPSVAPSSRPAGIPGAWPRPYSSGPGSTSSSTRRGITSAPSIWCGIRGSTSR